MGDKDDDCPHNGSDDTDIGDDDHYDGADDDSKDWGMEMMIVHIMEVWSKP